ncbi:MAG: NmrA family NAD(P)-binding protein [Aggregatilineales bacterium]
MEAIQKRVVVHGGTGVQGRPIAEGFLKAGFSTRVITRDPEKAQSLKDAGAEIVQADLGDVTSLEKAYADVDVLALLIPFFVTPPGDPMTYMNNAMTAAKSAGIKQIIWNTGGSLLDDLIGNASVDFRYHLFAMLKASGIPYTVFAPPAYMENLAGPWTASAISGEDVLAYPILDGDAIGWITVHDVAKLVVSAAQNGVTSQEIFRVNGPDALTGEQMAAHFTNALGRTITYRALTPDEFGQQLGMFFGETEGKGIAENYRFVQANHDLLMNYQDMTPILNTFPVTLTSLEGWVRQNAPLFNG